VIPRPQQEVRGPLPIEADLEVVGKQLGRPARGVHAVAHRCPCGLPDVVETEPLLPDGSPFPTLYYLTCPRAASAIGRLEADGMMAEQTRRLGADADLRAAYRRAHENYLERRQQLGDDPRISGVSAGGMPTRVKCLHVLAAHALAAGPGVNPLGDEALDAAGAWWSAGPCVSVEPVRPGPPGTWSGPAELGELEQPGEPR